MKACTYFLLFGAIAYVNPIPVSTPKKDKRDNNPTLRSIPDTNVKETAKNVFEATNETEAYSTVKTFTDFMQELVIILNTYNDDIFEDFVHIVDKEIKKYPYRSQNEFKNLLAEESNLMMRKSVDTQRAVINQIVDMMKLLKIFDRNVKDMLNYINSLYREDAKIKFRKILNRLKGYSAGYGKTRTKSDFGRLIRESVRATVFIHTNLNTDIKRKLKKHIDTFMKKIKKFPTSTTFTTIFIAFKSTISKSNTYTVTISENISTEDKTVKPPSKLDLTKTTAHIKEEKKEFRSFSTNTSEGRDEDPDISIKVSCAIANGNSTGDDSNSEQTNNITHLSTKETATEVMFYMTTEKPGIVYKSESRSQLVEQMFEKESMERRAAGQLTTTPGQRLTTNKVLRRIRAELPGEERRVGILKTGTRTSGRKSHTKNNKLTTERLELKDHLKRMRQLQSEVDRLKTINEINHYSKLFNAVENNGINEHETKDNDHKVKDTKEAVNKGIGKHETKDKEHKVKDTEEHVNNGIGERKTKDKEHKVKDTEEAVNKGIGEHKTKDNKHKVKDTEEDVNNGINEHETKDKKHKVKDTEEHVNNGIGEHVTKDKKHKVKDTEEHVNNGIGDHVTKDKKHKVKDTEEDVKKTNTVSEGGQDLGRSAKIVDDDDHHDLSSLRNNSHKFIPKKKDTKKTTKAAETTTKTNKHKSKNLVLSSSEPLSTAKDNAANRKHDKKVDNSALKDSEGIKQSRIEVNATKSIIKVTEDNKNETTIGHSFRRLVEAYPSLFEGQTLKQGLYPAHLWD